MNCPKCGAIVLKVDPVCKKCGAVLNEASDYYQEKVIYRSRFMLLFRAWLGACNGSHLKWLGYDEAAEYIRNQFGIGSMVESIFGAMINPWRWLDLIGMMIYQSAECTKIIFGAYREDAAGNPVRYFRPKKKKKK